MKTPKLPESTGRTRQFFHGALVQRRKDLGWSMQKLADEWTAYALAQARKYGEPTEKVGISRQYVWKLEHMFDDNAAPALKRLRVSTSLNSYGIWARVMGLRIRLELVEADEERDILFLDPAPARTARRLAALPGDYQEHIAGIVDALWAAYEDGESGEPVLRNWTPDKV